MQEIQAGLPEPNQVLYQPLGKQGDNHTLPAISAVPNATGREVLSDLNVPATDCPLSISVPAIANVNACVSDICDGNAVHILALASPMASCVNSELTEGKPSGDSDFQAYDNHVKNDMLCDANVCIDVVHDCKTTLADDFSVTASLGSGLSGEASVSPDISDPQVNAEMIYPKCVVYCGVTVQTDMPSTVDNLSSEPHTGIPVSPDPRKFDFQQLTSDLTRQLAETCSSTYELVLPSDPNLHALSGQTAKLPAAEAQPKVYRENGKLSSEPIPQVTYTPGEDMVHVNLLEAHTDRTQEVLGVCSQLEQGQPDPLSGSLAPTREPADDVNVTPRLSYSQKASLKRTAPPQRNLRRNPGQTIAVVHRRDTGTHRPLWLNPYRTPPEVQAEVKRKLEEMLQLAVLRKSSSPQAARFCEDYRKPDDITLTVAYPMSPIGDLLDWPASANNPTTTDLGHGYWQVPNVPEARMESPFITLFDLNASMWTSFGVINAPATFPQALHDLLESKHGYTVTYPDNITVFYPPWEQHCDHLSLVLGQLSIANLTVEPDADQIARTEVQASQPTAGYYRQITKPCSILAKPLTDATGKKQPNKVTWNPELEQAFRALKEALASAPVLQAPDFSRQFMVQTDASDHGLGAVLSQVDATGNEHPVLYLSRKLLPREAAYSTTEKECLAIVWALQKLQSYLYGRSFMVITDHNPLSWLKRTAGTNGKLLRWSLALQQYDFTIQHKPGNRHQNADGLSRCNEPQ